MTDEHRQSKWTDEEQAERTIVLQVLRDDRDERWTPAELEAEIEDRGAQAIAEALGRLEAEGAVVRYGEHVLASRCASRMDYLGLVTI